MDNNKAVTLTVSAAQFAAIRKLSLKYDNMSVEQYAARLFAQVVRNYFKTDLKAAATKAGEQWDAATKLGFDTKLSREEYVSRSVKEAKAIWLNLNQSSAIDTE